jgi:2-C-methyl-D-erythritol 2,4-cyclodiphosphate synthase
MINHRVGFGFDVHRISPKKKDLILAGVKVSANFSLRAVSDGDVVLHAMADALCGAACLGDIGDYFSPLAKSSQGMNSKKIVSSILKKVNRKYKINNIDIVIIAEKPRLVKYKNKMTESLKKIFSVKNINVKIKSKENLDILGGKNAICAMAIAQIIKK